MLFRRTSLGVGLFLGLGAAALNAQQPFPIVTFYDPYTFSCNNNSAGDSGFVLLKNLGITHLVGAGNSVVNSKALANGIKLITIEAGVNISSAAPYTLDRFADQGYITDFEVEQQLVNNNRGYAFKRRTNVSDQSGDTGYISIASNPNHQPGYMFTGPKDSSSRHFSPKAKDTTWCRADFVMSVGNVSGDPNTVVAKVVVASPNLWCRWCQPYDCQSFGGCPTCYFVACTTGAGPVPAPDSFRTNVTVAGIPLKVDKIVNTGSDTNWAQTFAWVREVKVSNFSGPNVPTTISVPYLQIKDYPFAFQVYWTKQKDVFVDRVSVSNFAGRRLDSLVTKPQHPESLSARTAIQNYYQPLQSNPLFRWYLADEPYGGSVQNMNNADDLLRDVPNAGQIRLFTSFTTGWRPSRAYEDFLTTLAVPELASEFYANPCVVDSTSSSQDTIITGGVKTVSRQKNFNDAISDMKDLYNRVTV